MSNELIMIENLIHDHEAIREHLKQVAKLADDWEQLEQEDLDPTDPAITEDLSFKHINLKQTMGYLEDGIRQHQNYEDEILPSLVGEQVMDALKIEHSEIQKQLKEIKFILLNINPNGLLANMDYLKLIISNLCDLLNHHDEVENLILNLLKKKFI